MSNVRIQNVRMNDSRVHWMGPNIFLCHPSRPTLAVELISSSSVSVSSSAFSKRPPFLSVLSSMFWRRFRKTRWLFWMKDEQDDNVADEGMEDDDVAKGSVEDDKVKDDDVRE